MSNAPTSGDMAYYAARDAKRENEELRAQLASLEQRVAELERTLRTPKPAGRVGEWTIHHMEVHDIGRQPLNGIIWPAGHAGTHGVAGEVRGSRWRKLDRTTPSGKMLFQCSTCGRESPTPDKVCSRSGCHD